MLNRLRALWATNPVRVTAILTSIIVFAAAKTGILIDQADVLEALTLALPILLGGEIARAKVTPYQGDTATRSDELLDLSNGPSPTQ